MISGFPRRNRLWSCLCVVVAMTAAGRAAPATQVEASAADAETVQPLKDRMEPTPPELQNVDVEEHLGVLLPLDLEFVDEQGRAVRLDDYFTGNRPVILTLNYYACPMLCTLQLNGMIEGLKGLDWNPGREFEIVTISINPLESPMLAREKKQNYIAEYGRAEAAAGWHFLTGRKSNIEAVAQTVGFGYQYDPKSNEYAHPAVAILVSPDGRVTRYLYGIEYASKTLRLALVEAGEGRIGSTLDRFILTCFHYDPLSRSYAPQALGMMRAGGALTILILGIALLGFWARELRRHKTITLPQDSHP